MKVLLYEHVSSGGYAGETIPTSLLSEGFAMLRGLTVDFKAAGHEVTVLIDSRLAALSPPIAADHTVQVSSTGQADQSMERSAEIVDAVFVVAPESNHILQQMVECMETTGAHSLNCRPGAIEEAADKPALPARAKRLGLNFPRTLTLSSDAYLEDIKRAIKDEIGFPVVLKPSSGAGCSGMSIARTGEEVEDAVDRILAEVASDITIQEYIDGVPASVSVICTGSLAAPVSLNLQDITLSNPSGVSSYNGGLVPFEHPQAGEALAAAERLVESFQELRGYVGIDFILTNKKAYMVEVNPRLTTSYVGLRKVAPFNVPEAIKQAVLKNELPDAASNIGVACFSKVPVSRPVIFAWQDFLGMEALIAPPFPVAGEETSWGMLQAYGETAQDALGRLRDAKERLRAAWEKGQHPW